MNFDWAKKLTDKQWAKALSGKSNYEYSLPPLPSETIQKNFVGSSGFDTFKEPIIFFKLLREATNKMGCPLTNQSKILDFGVGWGRFYRWLLRDFLPENIIGVDVDPEMIELCKRDIPYGVFEEVPPRPPYAFKDDEFDLIFLYSVFSHLSESSFLDIMSDFKRILEPGGFVAFTTLKEIHLNVWNSQYSTRKELYESIGFDFDSWKKKALDGKFLFVPTGGGSHSRPDTFYGEAIITRLYMEKNLPSIDFEIVKFNDDTELPQTFILLRKKP